MGKSLTDAEKQAERRYLQLIVEGGNDLADLLEAIPLKDLISHLRKYKRDKRRAPRGD